MIPVYEILVSVAFVSFAALGWWNLKRSAHGALISLHQWLHAALLVGLFAMGGSWFFQSLVAQSWWQRGTALYGGIAGAFLALYISSRLLFGRGRLLTRRDFVDAAVPGMAISQAIGRLGCLWAHCCYGRQLQWMGNSFEAPVIQAEVIFALSMAIYLERRWLQPAPRKRSLTLMYLYAYAVFRFLAEFLRGDLGRGLAGGLTSSQWASLLALSAAIFLDFKGRTGDKSPL